MAINDYMIAVDETGQPFIVHAKSYHGYKSGQILKGRHFGYLVKVKLPNGKTRYIYTQKAYKAWLKNQSKDKTEKEVLKSTNASKKFQPKPKILPKNWKEY